MTLETGVPDRLTNSSLQLKIKCDRLTPCSNCVKRGVSKVCPDATVSYNAGRWVSIYHAVRPALLLRRI